MNEPDHKPAVVDVQIMDEYPAILILRGATGHAFTADKFDILAAAKACEKRYDEEYKALVKASAQDGQFEKAETLVQREEELKSLYTKLGYTDPDTVITEISKLARHRAMQHSK